MKQEDLFKKLGLILNELNEQYQYLAVNPQQLNELELELFHANANFLTEHIHILKKINVQSAPLELPVADHVTEEPASPAVISDGFHEDSQVEQLTFSPQEEDVEDQHIDGKADIEVEPEPAISEIEQEVFKLDSSPSTFEFILNDHAEHEKFDFEDKSVDELFNRPLSDEEEKILAQKIKLREQASAESVDVEEDEIGPEPFLVTKAPTFPIEKEDLDLEVAPPSEVEVNTKEPVEDPTYKPTLNDILARSAAKGNINSSTSNEVKDLRQAISLNDKLLYIKDLFNGYSLAYGDAIDFANKLPNFEAADNFFQKNYAVKNDWASKQKTVDKFYELLNRRFRS